MSFDIQITTFFILSTCVCHVVIT